MKRPRRIAAAAQRARRAVAFVQRNARPLMATAALAAITAGLYLERPSLALLIPGAIVFAALAWSHLKGTHDA
jgi:hypothetical protein